MRSISKEELQNEIESYLEAAKSAKGDSAMRLLNYAENALKSYEGVPENFFKAYAKLIEDMRDDII